MINTSRAHKICVELSFSVSWKIQRIKDASNTSTFVFFFKEYLEEKITIRTKKKDKITFKTYEDLENCVNMALVPLHSCGVFLTVGRQISILNIKTDTEFILLSFFFLALSAFSRDRNC